MMQIIEESFDTIKDARNYINNISLNYEYVKDIDIIYNEKNKYIAIIKFDIECNYEVYSTFDLANIEERKGKENEVKYIWEVDYYIKFPDKRLKDGELFKGIKSYISTYKEHGYSFELTTSFGIKDWINIITINCSGYGDYEVILSDFSFDSYYGFMNRTKEHFFTKEIDADILYNHIIETYKQRGYLFDRFSLKTIRTLSNGISLGINERRIEEHIKKKN
ncbi:hypothetical protein DDA98_14665 [Clostridium perfringens]|uniref:hypothetical protein n=1 Tax=Clostridium perfringens TaxID=1502 RepID=UPI000D51C831|nr:hypothetical protein [Clostridium perfringens]PVE14360.1 hypothetical protein DDA98_14665 [Clostridium perfringens]